MRPDMSGCPPISDLGERRESGQAMPINAADEWTRYVVRG